MSRKPGIDEIRARLVAALPDATELVIDDDSAAHVGHPGAAGGAGHFRVRIRAPRFAGMPVMQRHRLVYDALADWMPDRIHALSIDAQPAPTPSQ
ncbi:MAG: BolA family protein [Burkholderiaceae bacterium]